MSVRKHSATAGVCIAIAIGAVGCGYSAQTKGPGDGASGGKVAECERGMKALDKTAEILEERGEIPSGEQRPSDALEERWGSC